MPPKRESHPAPQPTEEEKIEFQLLLDQIQKNEFSQHNLSKFIQLCSTDQQTAAIHRFTYFKGVSAAARFRECPSIPVQFVPPPSTSPCSSSQTATADSDSGPAYKRTKYSNSPRPKPSGPVQPEAQPHQAMPHGNITCPEDLRELHRREIWGKVGEWRNEWNLWTDSQLMHALREARKLYSRMPNTFYRDFGKPEEASKESYPEEDWYSALYNQY